MGGPAGGLESDFRPHFFAGVATVVAKLLIAATPDIAVFGEKDYQQLLVVQQLARDLALPTCGILGAPTLREADGLAMSSAMPICRPQERQIAGRLNAIPEGRDRPGGDGRFAGGGSARHRNLVDGRFQPCGLRCHQGRRGRWNTLPAWNALPVSWRQSRSAKTRG